MHHFYLHWWKKWWFQANCDYNFSSILVGSPYHARFQLWIVQVVSKERHTKQLMSTTERKQHEMAHYLSPSIYSLYIFWPLSSVNLLSIPFICIPIYIYILCHLIDTYESQMKCQRQPQSPESCRFARNTCKMVGASHQLHELVFQTDPTDTESLGVTLQPVEPSN